MMWVNFFGSNKNRNVDYNICFCDFGSGRLSQRHHGHMSARVVDGIETCESGREHPTYDTQLFLSPLFLPPPTSASRPLSQSAVAHTFVFFISPFAALSCSAFLAHNLMLRLFGFNTQRPTDQVHARTSGRDPTVHLCLSLSLSAAAWEEWLSLLACLYSSASMSSEHGVLTHVHPNACVLAQGLPNQVPDLFFPRACLRGVGPDNIHTQPTTQHPQQVEISTTSTG